MNKNLDIRAFLVFQRLQRFYKTLNVVSALLAGLSLAVLTFDEFHPTQSGLIRAAEGLLCSSALSSVVSVMVSTMLLFKFEGRESATRKDLAIAWTPLAIMDLAIVEFLFALVLWYSGKNNRWRTALMSSQLALLLGYCVWISFWMWNTMSGKGGLGREEARAATKEKRTADNWKKVLKGLQGSSVHRERRSIRHSSILNLLISYLAPQSQSQPLSYVPTFISSAVIAEYGDTTSCHSFKLRVIPVWSRPSRAPPTLSALAFLKLLPSF